MALQRGAWKPWIVISQFFWLFLLLVHLPTVDKWGQRHIHKLTVLCHIESIGSSYTTGWFIAHKRYMSQVYRLLADCDERSSNLTSFHHLLVNITASDGEILQTWDGFKFMAADKSFIVFKFLLNCHFCHGQQIFTIIFLENTGSKISGSVIWNSLHPFICYCFQVIIMFNGNRSSSAGHPHLQSRIDHITVHRTQKKGTLMV